MANILWLFKKIGNVIWDVAEKFSIDQSSGDVGVTGDVHLVAGNFLYLKGDQSTDGSVRVYVPTSGDNAGKMVVETRTGGSWIEETIGKLTPTQESQLSDAYSHVSDTENPHAVDKTDVGLENVENTQLSTWAGSTNLTTLGTITTGTWNGSPISSAYIDLGTLELGGDPIYFKGDSTTDGSIRMYVPSSGDHSNELVVEFRVSGTWTYAGSFVEPI